jgi:hypothetical protein
VIVVAALHAQQTAKSDTPDMDSTHWSASAENCYMEQLSKAGDAGALYNRRFFLARGEAAGALEVDMNAR